MRLKRFRDTFMANLLYEKHFLISRIVLKIIKKSKKLFFIWKFHLLKSFLSSNWKFLNSSIYSPCPLSSKAKVFFSRVHIYTIIFYLFLDFAFETPKYSTFYFYWFLVSNPGKDIDDIFFSRILVFPFTPHGYQTGKNRKPDPPFLGAS